jgi:hypothetical protein
MRIHRFTIGGSPSILIRMTHARNDALEAFQLAARRLFDIPDAAAVQIRCTAGSLWITLDHDPRDIILAPGESFTTGEHRRALLYALEPASFALSLPQRQRGAALPQPVAA